MDDIERLIRDIGKIPKELKRELRPGLRAAAKPVLDRARRNASWSTRIPGATKISITFAGRRPGVKIVTNAKRAPHARPFENLGDQGTFRHPVWGNRDVWVTQKARPFLFPALEVKGGEAVKEISRVVDRATRDAGFR